MEPTLSAETAHLICVVEDDDAVRASARLLLEGEGYAVRDYASAEAILADDAARDAACLLLDFQLGGITGLELLENLRVRGVSTPAIILTANASPPNARLQRANVLAVLRKPAPAPEMLDWIQKACSRT